MVWAPSQKVLETMVLIFLAGAIFIWMNMLAETLGRMMMCMKNKHQQFTVKLSKKRTPTVPALFLKPS
jgi:hypothetical protein